MTGAPWLPGDGWHVLDEQASHPDGGWVALCGHAMPGAGLPGEPSGRPCHACATLATARAVIPCHDGQIPGRPPVERPVRDSRRSAGPGSAGDRAC